MTWISAHRCATPAQLDAALALDVEYVELDVRLAADGTFLVAHDEPADDDPADRFRYADALERLRATDRRLHLDLKLVPGPGEWEVAAVRLAVEALGPDAVAVTTLEDESVRAIRDWADAAGTPLLVGLSLGRGWTGLGPLAGLRQLRSELFPGRRVDGSRANLVVAHRRLARLTVARFARRRGLPLLVWTVDSPRGLRFWLARDRAWLVTTNRPGEAWAIRKVINKQA